RRPHQRKRQSGGPLHPTRSRRPRPPPLRQPRRFEAIGRAKSSRRPEKANLIAWSGSALRRPVHCFLPCVARFFSVLSVPSVLKISFAYVTKTHACPRHHVRHIR